MSTERELELDAALQGLAESLDISPSKYKQAVERYQAVGEWLAGRQYEGCTGLPEIAPQGSFRLGTVVRPIRDGKEADYDIDLVCRLPIGKDATTPAALKNAVGNRLKENGDYRRMLGPEGRRCWTLKYAEQDGIGFHIDTLPAAPADDTRKATAPGPGHSMAVRPACSVHNGEGQTYQLVFVEGWRHQSEGILRVVRQCEP